jgi:serine/threonine protein kinase
MNCPACNSANPSDAKFCGSCGRKLVEAQQQAAPDISSLYTVESDARVGPPPASTTGLAPGSVFAGRYEIKAQLGGPGGGEHYLARDRVAGTDVSLKLVSLDPRFGGDIRARFLREAATARDIRHPNIAAVYDVGESDGQGYFTMEALEGVSLRDWNRRRLTSGAELGMSSISAIIFAILDAIVTVHIRNLVRIDLKPANVVLLSDPSHPSVRLKLTDIGIPYIADGNDSAATGFGASPYRAPEALTAGGSELQPSADIYSVSMIFYELLTGVPLAGHWQAPSAGRKDVPPAIDILIQNGLSNNPRRRPQSVEEYRRALEQALGPVLREDPKPAPRPAPKPDPKPDPKPAPGPQVVVKTWPVPNFLVPILKTLNMPFAMIVIMIQNIVSWIEVLMFTTRPLPLGQKRAARGWLTALVSIVLIGIVGLGAWGVSTLIENGSGAILADAGGDVIEPSPVPKPEPSPQPLFDTRPEPQPEPEPPPPPRSQFAGFNGYWTDDFGDTWTANVDSLGRTQALATGGFFAGSQLVGAFNGRRFEFVVGNAYGTGAAVGTFDGGCHITYQTLDPYGSGRMVNANLHINHQPGAPCP